MRFRLRTLMIVMATPLVLWAAFWLGTCLLMYLFVDHISPVDGHPAFSESK